MNKGIKQVDFYQTFPQALKHDEKMAALGKIIAEELHITANEAEKNIIYTDIDKLAEKWLDILAYDLHVDWYDYDATVDIKRAIIKNSVRVHQKLGTKASVERALRELYPLSKIEEWFEYGGEPHHFKIKVLNQIFTTEQKKKYLNTLEKVKRKSALLEMIIYVFQYELINQHNIAISNTHCIRLSPFNSHIIGRRDGKHKRDGTLTRAGYTVVPYQFQILNYNKAFLDNVNIITPKVLYDFMLKSSIETKVGKVTYSISLSPFNSYIVARRDGKQKRNGTVTRAGYTGIKPYQLPVKTTVSTVLQNENTIENTVLTTKAPIRRNGRYKRDGTAYRDGQTAKYNL